MSRNSVSATSPCTSPVEEKTEYDYKEGSDHSVSKARPTRNRKKRQSDDFYFYGASTTSTPLPKKAKTDHVESVTFDESASFDATPNDSIISLDGSRTSTTLTKEKKRGRPRKFTSPPNDQSAHSLSAVDRDNRDEMETTGDQEREVNETVGNTVSVEKDNTSSNLENDMKSQSILVHSIETNISGTTMKRQKGRPRKSGMVTNAINRNDGKEEDSCHDIEKSSGKSMSDQSTPVNKTPTIKRKKGRPKKFTSNLNELPSFSNSDVSPVDEVEKKPDNDHEYNGHQEIESDNSATNLENDIESKSVLEEKNRHPTLTATYVGKEDEDNSKSPSKRQEGVASGSAEKRKRGRPRKFGTIQKDIEINDSTSATMNSKEKRAGSFHSIEEYSRTSVSNQSYSVKEGAGTSLSLKADGGRKIEIVSTDIHMDNSVTSGGQNQTEKSFHINDDDKSETSISFHDRQMDNNTSVGATIKRGRGRPRKFPLIKEASEGKHEFRHQLPVAAVSSMTNSSNTDDSIGEFNDGTNTSSRGRGRGRGRGRPKTNVSQSDGLKCPHCEVPFNLAGLKTHLMAKHSLAYVPGELNGVDRPFLVVKKQGHIDCQRCSRRFTNAQYYKHHQEWCGRENEMFFCEICKRQTPAMWRTQHMRNHDNQERKKAMAQKKQEEEEERKCEEEEENKVEDETGNKRKRKAARSALSLMQKITSNAEEGTVESGNESDFDDTKEVDDNEDDDEDDEEIGDEEIGNKKEAKSKPVIKDRECRIQREKKRDEEVWLETCRLTSRITPLQTMEQLYDFYYGNSQSTLFPEMAAVREEWKALTLSSERDRYLPSRRQSPQVSSRLTGAKARPTTFTLKIGEAKCITGKYFCYVGGPIWALEWCPTPTLSPHEQVLAVASDSEPGPKVYANNVLEGSNLLQFWTLGKIDNESTEVSPRLAFCLAHDNGCVRSMSWCPTGCCDQVEVREENLVQGSKFPRLGLLAVACSNSTIPIFSIPHPSGVDHLNPSTPDRERPLVVKPKPVLTLVPNSKTGATPCLSVSWQRGEGCQRIIGGYGRGEVLMWIIGTKTSLLNEDAQTLRPVRVFMRHKCGVNVCAWSPLSPNMFVSSDFNGIINLWNSDRPVQPESVIKRKDGSLTRAMCWAGPSHWGLYTGNDRHNVPSSLIRSDSVRNGVKVSFHGLTSQCSLSCDYALPVVLHPVITWDVTFDPVFNVLVSCDTLGNVLVSLPPMDKLLTSDFKINLPYQAPQSLLYKASVAGNEDTSAKDSEKRESSQKGSECSKVNASSVDNYSLQYKECQRDFSELKKPTASRFRGKIDHNEKETYGGSNMEAIHRVRLCPSMQCSLWLASGGNSGVLRFDCLSNIVTPHSRRIETALQDLKLNKRTGTTNS